MYIRFVIIDNESQIQHIIHSDLLVYPIAEDDRLHPNRAKIIAYALYDVDDDASYVVSVNHPEGLYHISDLSMFTGNLYCAHIELIQFNGNRTSNMIDYDLVYYLHTNTIYELPIDNSTQHYTRMYANCHKINSLVSLLKLQDKAKQLYSPKVPLTVPNGYDFYNTRLKQSFLNIQANALHVDATLFQQVFGLTFSQDNNKCYTQYNYYTTTGRPSNRFGGINYAALPKDDDTRDCFVSRFGDEGVLLELDFNAYHPHIIASIIGYNFKKESVYEHFAKMYHNTNNPTTQQLEKAKEDTFRQLYGGIRRDYLTVPFFGATEELSKALWHNMQVDGYVESPISGRKLHYCNYKELSMPTLFNYYIQMLETELNANVLVNVFAYIKDNNLKSVPILYTYDSILFDIHRSELDVITNTIIPLCVDLDKFPIKLKSGKTYKNLCFYEN